MDATFDVLMLPTNQRNLRSLSLRSNDTAFRRLNKFFKGIMIYVYKVPRYADRKRKVECLVERAGCFEFENSSGNRTTVAVSLLVTILERSQLFFFNLGPLLGHAPNQDYERRSIWCQT
jgi:hypothetical protein